MSMLVLCKLPFHHVQTCQVAGENAPQIGGHVEFRLQRIASIESNESKRWIQSEVIQGTNGISGERENTVIAQQHLSF